MSLPLSTTNTKIHPMMPVARAAKLLDVSVKKLEKRLEQGLILGERRQISERNGGKYSWFIYAGAFESLLESRVKVCEARISTEGLDQLFCTEFDDGAMTQNECSSDFTELKINLRQFIEIDEEGTTLDAAPRFGLSLVNSAKDLNTSQIAPQAIASSVEDIACFTAVQSDNDLRSPIDIIDFTAEYYCEEDEQNLQATSANGTERNTNLALATELLQHLRQERQRNEMLQARIDELAGQVISLHDEMSAIRIEILSKPDYDSQKQTTGQKPGWFGKVKSYFGFSDGRM